jgi:hypothetical protein
MHIHMSKRASFYFLTWRLIFDAFVYEQISDSRKVQRLQNSAVIYLPMPMPKPSCAILEFYIGVHSNSTHFNTKITNMTFYKIK